MGNDSKPQPKPQQKPERTWVNKGSRSGAVPRPSEVVKVPGEYVERGPKGGEIKQRPTDTSYRVAPGNKGRE